MIFASVCSGIEAASVAWHPLGWTCAWVSEIEDFPSAVLKYRYPSVPNLGDMTKLNENKTYIESAFDVLVGGTPCQGFSVAGLRGGLDDERSSLSLEYCRILVAKQPRWFVWENVPGTLSSFSDEEGSDKRLDREERPGDVDECVEVVQSADFATLLTAFRECGYCVAYRILDAKHFGVPQRRRRIFVVGHLGDDWRPPVAVLFERESLRRDFAPGKKKGKGIAGTAEESIGGSGEFSIVSNGQANAEIVSDGSPSLTCNHEAPILVPSQAMPAKEASTLNSKFGDKQGLEDQHALNGAPLFVPVVLDGRGFGDGNNATAIVGNNNDRVTEYTNLVFDNTQITSPTNGNNPKVGDPVHTISKGNAHNACIVSIQATQIGRSDGAGPQGSGFSDDISFTLTKNDVHAVADLRNMVLNSECSQTLQAKKSGYSYNAMPVVVSTTGESCPIIIDRAAFNQGENAEGTFNFEQTETMGTVISKGPHAIFQSWASENNSMNPGGVSPTVDTGKAQGLVVYSIMPMNSGKDYKARQVEVCQPSVAGRPTTGNQGGDYVIQLGHTQSNGSGISEGQTGNTLEGVSSANQAVAFTQNQSGDVLSGETMHSLGTNANASCRNAPNVMTNRIRRITPLECARLQGFPDDWCRIPYKGKSADKCPDGPQYKAYGNSMAVPVMAWIGKRLDMVDKLLSKLHNEK